MCSLPNSIIWLTIQIISSWYLSDTLISDWYLHTYRVRKNSMPKLCEVIWGTETKIYCQATVCPTCVLAVPRTIKMGPTTVGNQAKSLKYSEESCISYQFRADDHEKLDLHMASWFCRELLRQQQPSGTNLEFFSAHVNLCCVSVELGVWCVSRWVPVYLDICSQLVPNYIFFFPLRIQQWFCLVSNLSQTHFHGPWHRKEAYPTYSCLTINLCFGPPYHFTSFSTSCIYIYSMDLLVCHTHSWMWNKS